VSKHTQRIIKVLFLSPTDAPVNCLKKNNIKIYIKIYTKAAPTRTLPDDGVTVTPKPVGDVLM